MSKSAIIVGERFGRVWPLSANHFQKLWREQGELEYIQTSTDRTASELVADPASITRLIVLNIPFTLQCEAAFANLQEVSIYSAYEPIHNDAIELLKKRGVHIYHHRSEGFWGQSVAEFGLALTMCGLRRIPQLHHTIMTDTSPWSQFWPEGSAVSPTGEQYLDDARFANGTVSGKRIRIVGAGNIASRYAKFTSMLGADVAAWDPYAPETAFHLANSRRVHHLSELLHDAEIFAPMVPLLPTTEGIITAKHIHALPKGCLVVLVTRAGICDMNAIRERVLADEISLAADVFDIEPLSVDDPLIGRHNVVHTPHYAGRTAHANEQFAKMLLDQFIPV